MQAFRFRLERVLAWHRKQAQLEESRLIPRMAQVDRVQNEIAGLKAERLMIEHGVVAGAIIDAQDFAALGFYRLRATAKELELEVELERRQKDVRDQMEILKAAQRRVRLVEKLRERRAGEHAYLADRELEAVAAAAHLANWSKD